MSKTAKQILEESRALRLSFNQKNQVAKVTLEQPTFAAEPFRYWYCQVLTNPNHSWEDILINLFTTDGPVGEPFPDGPPVGTTVIIHNHDRNKHCVTKTRCYVLGFQREET